MLLITNNEFFKDAIKRNDVTVEYIEIDYIGILKKARDLIHQNYFRVVDFDIISQTLDRILI